MRPYILLYALIGLVACQGPIGQSKRESIDWGNRRVSAPLPDSLSTGATYLSVYSEVYSHSEHKTHPLTVTVSMRNMNTRDTVFVTHADYFDTGGQLLHTYVAQPIFLAPMETLEIVIDEGELAGGTGSNFLFHWSGPPRATGPLFEGVMISTVGQQGLSFTTQGVRVE